MKRGRRGSTREDLELWENVARTVKPLRGRRQPARAKAENASPLDGEKEKKQRPARPAAKPSKPAPAPPAQPPRLVPLDRRARTRIARGTTAIDARLDLHGLTQQAAYERLARFIASAQADGARLILVITGKGGSEDEHATGGRGVLRRSVPLWLSAPEFRPYVIGFEAAGRRHGREGALYVRLRAPKPPRS